MTCFLKSGLVDRLLPQVQGRRPRHCRNGALHLRPSVAVSAVFIIALTQTPSVAAEADPSAAQLGEDEVGSCPAGPSGAACRSAAGDTGTASSADADFGWRSFTGCAIPAGSDFDLGEPELLTVEGAKLRCSELEKCVGFTFEGNDPDGPLSGGPTWAHLKARFDCIEADWVAYRKVQERRAATAPAPPPLPPPRRQAADWTEWTASEEADEPEYGIGSGKGVALCLSGQVRMLQTTAAAMQQNLIDVLHPEVFMYGPRPKERDVAEPDLYELRDHVVSARWEDEDIRTRLYSETRNPGRTIDLDYVEVQGNWLGSQCLSPPLRDNRPGSAVCMYYNQQKCLDMIRDQEAERGQPYEWVVVSRTDFRWMAPHPPLDLLADEDAVWIPSGSDWEGGLNDRHAVMRRKFAEQYLSGWQFLTRGRAKDVMLEALGSMKVMGYPGPNTESFLKARLAHYDVPVQRFPNVAYLTCTQRTKSRWTQCSGTSSNDAPGWLYKEEMEHATRVAKCVRFSWTARKMEDCADDISHLYRGIR